MLHLDLDLLYVAYKTRLFHGRQSIFNQGDDKTNFSHTEAWLKSLVGLFLLLRFLGWVGMTNGTNVRRGEKKS